MTAALVRNTALSTTNSSGGTLTITASTVGNLLLAIVHVRSASVTPNTMSDSGGNTWTAGAAVATAGGVSVRAFYSVQTVSSTTVTVALTGGSSTHTMNVSEWSKDAGETWAFVNGAGVQTTSATTGPTGASVTTTANSTALAAGISYLTNTAPTVAASWALMTGTGQGGGTAWYSGRAQLVSSTSGAKAPTWTTPSTASANVTIAVEAQPAVLSKAAALAATATITAAGASSGVSTGSSLAAVAAITTAGVVGKSSGASIAATATLTATGPSTLVMSEDFNGTDSTVITDETYCNFDGSFSTLTEHTSASGNPSSKWMMDTGALTRKSGWGWTGKASTYGSPFFFRCRTRTQQATEATVEFDYKVASWASGSSGTNSTGDGTAVWLRYQTQWGALYEAYVDKFDNKIGVKRKVPAISYTGTAGTSNSGVYYTLLSDAACPVIGAGTLQATYAAVGSSSLVRDATDTTGAGGTTYHFKVTIRTLSTNVVQVQIFRDGTLVWSCRDTANDCISETNSISLATDLANGRYNTGDARWNAPTMANPIQVTGYSGMRSDNAQAWFDNFTLTETAASTDFTGSASLAATGTITAAGVVGRSSGASLAATGTITAAGAAGSGASLAATATLTADGAAVAGTGASIAATDTITASGSAGLSQGASLSATATTTAAGSAGLSQGAALSATGTTTATGSTGVSQGAAIAGTATTTAAGAVATSTGASLAATDAITATGSAGKASAVTLSATATTTAAGAVATSTGAALNATGTITAAGSAGLSQGAALAATATISASAGGNVATGSSLAATATLTATGQVAVSGAATRSATATLTATGATGTSAGATLSTTASLTAAGTVASSTGATLVGTATVTATGSVGKSSGATLTATASIGAGPKATGSVAVNAAGAITATSVVGATSAAAVVATGTITADGSVLLSGSATLAAVASISVVGDSHAPHGLVTTPPERTLAVPAEARVGSVDPEDRVVTVAADVRVASIAAESRTLTA